MKRKTLDSLLQFYWYKVEDKASPLLSSLTPVGSLFLLDKKDLGLGRVLFRL